METKPVNWVKKWPKQDYANFSKQQITNAKRIYKELAIVRIDEQIKKLGKKITYTLRWREERGLPLYYLICHTNPPAKLIPKTGKKGGGPANITPKSPPNP